MVRMSCSSWSCHMEDLVPSVGWRFNIDCFLSSTAHHHSRSPRWISQHWKTSRAPTSVRYHRSLLSRLADIAQGRRASRSVKVPSRMCTRVRSADCNTCSMLTRTGIEKATGRKSIAEASRLKANALSRHQEDQGRRDEGRAGHDGPA
jgi:hypothetical protein